MRDITKELIVANPDDRKFTGFASVETVDKDGEILPIDEIGKHMDTWMKRGAPIIDSHSNRVIGRGLNWQFEDKSGKKGIIITGEVYKDYKLDNEIWENIKSGKITGLSFGGAQFKRESKNIKGQSVDVLSDLEAYEISVVEKPANPEALMEDINMLAKSDVKKTICPFCGKNILPDDNISEHINEEHGVSSYKGNVQKTEKFDRCVEEVKRKSPDVDAYAVCHSVLDKELTETEKSMAKTMKDMFDKEVADENESLLKNGKSMEMFGRQFKELSFKDRDVILSALGIDNAQNFKEKSGGKVMDIAKQPPFPPAEDEKKPKSPEEEEEAKAKKSDTTKEDVMVSLLKEIKGSLDMLTKKMDKQSPEKKSDEKDVKIPEVAEKSMSVLEKRLETVEKMFSTKVETPRPIMETRDVQKTENVNETAMEVLKFAKSGKTDWRAINDRIKKERTEELKKVMEGVV